MGMTLSDESDLEWYFRRSGEYQKSIAGPMFERADRLRYDENGVSIPRFRPNTWWRPDGGDEIIRTHEGGRSEPNYLPNFDDFFRHGKVSTALNLVVRRHRDLYQALEAYYGDRGAMWREFAADQFGDDGKPIRSGYGHGAIASLYVFTTLGRKLLVTEIGRLAGKQTGKKPVKRPAGKASDEVHRRPDDVLAALFAALAVQPDNALSDKLHKIRRQAETLLTAARSAYLTGVRVADRKPPPEPPRRVYAWHDERFDTRSR